jgi:hypothetical protein
VNALAVFFCRRGEGADGAADSSSDARRSARSRSSQLTAARVATAIRGRVERDEKERVLERKLAQFAGGRLGATQVAAGDRAGEPCVRWPWLVIGRSRVGPDRRSGEEEAEQKGGS